jgi:hypothetical protein
VGASSEEAASTITVRAESLETVGAIAVLGRKLGTVKATEEGWNLLYTTDVTLLI